MSEAEVEELLMLADGDWVSALLLRRAEINKVKDYENLYAMFHAGSRWPRSRPPG